MLNTVIQYYYYTLLQYYYFFLERGEEACYTLNM